MYGYGYFNSFKTVASGAVPVDPDAQAFITAASITNPTQQGAVNQLVLDLKAASLWTKMKRIYPMVGGTSTAHKYCLKSLTSGTFYGGMSHTSAGIVPNASNSYFDTGFKDSDFTSNANYHFGIYTPTTGSGLYDVGSHAGTTSKRSFIVANYSSTMYFAAFTDGFTSNANIDNGHFMVNYYDASLGGNTAYHLYKDGSYTAGQDQVSTVANGLNFFLCAINEAGSPTGYGNKTISFAHMGDKLTAAESSSLYTCIQAFQTTLSRNV